MQLPAPTGPAYDEQVRRIDGALQRIGELRSQRDVTPPDEGYGEASDFVDLTE